MKNNEDIKIHVNVILTVYVYINANKIVFA